MAVGQRLPPSVKGPLGFASLVVGILGVAVGYIFVLLGVTIYFDLNGLEGLGPADALVVVGSGLASLALGYLGWRGFMRFAY